MPQRPHEGPAGERQGRLPGLGTGHFGGGSEAFEPENWVQRPPGGGRIAAFHSSMEMTLPATDDPFQARGADADTEGVDIHGRPMAAFGSAIGIHLGSLQSAVTAGKEREYVHPVAIPNEAIVGPDDAPEEAKTPWKYRSAQPQKPNDPVSTNNRWLDDAANFSPHLTDLVEQGKILPYRNEYEDPGTTSYRGKPESLETWGEHVLNADQAEISRSKPSRAQVAAAKAGYEPVILQQRNREELENHVDLQGNPVSPDGTGAFDPMPYQGTLFPQNTLLEHDQRAGTSHYGEEAGPEASYWDSEVRKVHFLAMQEKTTQGRDQRNSIVNKLSMIQAGRRQ